jgi:hypothetical protein
MLYGSCLRADSLSNIPLNSRAIGVKIPFQAMRSEPIVGVRLTSPIRTGYTAGTGGNIRVTVIDEEGDACIGEIFQNNTDPYATAMFPNPFDPNEYDNFLLIANVADDAANNWRSVDGLVRNQVDPLDPPCLTELLYPGTPGWAAHPTNQPIWEVLYASSTGALPVGQGVGYVDVLNGAPGNAVTGIRQLIAPPRNIVVSGGAICLRGMTQPASITINSPNLVIASATLLPPAIPNGWASFYFANPITLNLGSAYSLQPQVVQPGVTAVAMQKGWQRAANGIDKNYTFAPQTFFNDGWAQEFVNGAWSDKISEQGSPTPATDWMFYLNV